MPLKIGTPLPELTGAAEWLNGEVKREDLIGSPVLVHFWAVSCSICHDNMSKLAEWRESYKAKGLKVVAIHKPRQEEDTNIEWVKKEVFMMKITEPCAIDNLHTMSDNFQNEFLPAYFLFDAEGNLRGRAAGYAGLKMIEAPLQKLLETI